MHSQEPAAESLLVMIIFLHFLPGGSSSALNGNRCARVCVLGLVTQGYYCPRLISLFSNERISSN